MADVEIQEYVTSSGKSLFSEWLRKLMVILLCEGVRKTQDSDIQKAKRYWVDYQREN